MTGSNPTPGEEPKKKSLKLLLRSKPAAKVDTAAGRIYLYPLRVRDMTDFEKLEPGEAVNQVRNFLTSIASLTVESDEAPERIPLDPEIAKTLSVDEVEQLAEAYVQSSGWQTVREDGQDHKPPSREEGKAASAYLIRLMRQEVEQQIQASKQLREKMLGSSSGLFDQVRKSTSALGSTLGAFERLTKPSRESTLETHPIQTDHLSRVNNLMAEQARERAKERAEEMELTRLTGQMTAESAKALKDLVDAATTMMEQMEARDQKTDQSTRTQIKIALWSVASSAVLALVAAILAGFSYFQDRDNNTAGDQWQAKVLTAIEQGNQQRSALERENQALLAQVKSQGTRLEGLEASQRTTAKAAASKQKPD
jgi:hypothetical protein